MLFVPGVRPDRFARAVGSGADAVILDLEDSVEPARKAEARDHVAAFLATAGPAAGPARYVRINAAGSPWWADDLGFARRLPHLDGLVVPKVEHPAAVEEAGAAIETRVVLPLVETARGLLAADRIARAAADVPGLLFGAEDLTAEIGIPRTLDGEELIYARSRVVIAATAAGVEPIDAVFVDLASPEGLRHDARRARAVGFTGKMAIHPDQIPVIHEVFTPSDEELARARRLIAAYEVARARGEGVLRLDNQMVDAPLVARARRLLARD